MTDRGARRTAREIFHNVMSMIIHNTEERETDEKEKQRERREQAAIQGSNSRIVCLSTGSVFGGSELLILIHL